MSRNDERSNAWPDDPGGLPVDPGSGRRARATALPGAGLVMVVLLGGYLAWSALDSKTGPARAGGKFLHQSSPLGTLAFTPDGRALALGHFDGALNVQDLSGAGGRPRQFEAGPREAVLAVAFSPDGRTLASAGQAPVVKLWDVDSGTVRSSIESPDAAVGSLAFSPDGKLLASGSFGGKVRLRDVETGREIFPLAGHSMDVRGLAFSPDGKLLASCSFDGTLKLWDVATGREHDAIRYRGQRIYSLAFAPDGRSLVFGLGSGLNGVRGQAVLWNLSGGREAIRVLGEASFASVAFSPDGKTVAGGGGERTITLWDVETGREFATLTGHEGYVTSVAFSPDGHLLATGGMDSLVGLFRIDPVAMKSPRHRL